jgi:TorA maturation chaperone TorD
MTLSVHDFQAELPATVPATDFAVVDMPEVAQIDEEQQYRASAYGLIATLLRTSPDQAMLDHLSGLAGSLPDEGDDMVLSMSALGLSARMHDPASIDDEFHELFIGLGKGELTPYASWYLTGFLMEKPLSDLRDDLGRLGYQRDENVKEPEDHAAALLEVMSMMITDGLDIDTQRQFFNAHILPWMGRFMRDLSGAGSAVFYKALGRFGAEFLALEDDYLSMQS